MNKKICAEYIWIDGQRPTAKLRSKTKILDLEQMKFESWSDNGFTQIIPSEEDNEVDPLSIPYWSFDGSSTEQAEGRFSDCILVPVQALPDPIRGGQNILVLNEVMNTDGSPHISNTRAILRKAVAQYTNEEPLFGIEQEYTLVQYQTEVPHSDLNTDGSPHISNTRAILRKAVAQYTNEEPLFGIEQEYTLVQYQTEVPH